MIQKMAFTLFLGRPMMMYVGILTFLLLIVSAVIGYLSFRGNTSNLIRWLMWLARLTIVVASIHAIFGLASYFNF